MHCDLWELMTARYGAGAGVPFMDATPAIHDGLTLIRNSGGGRGEIIVPGGFNGLIKSAINPNLLSGSTIRGDSPTASVLTYCLPTGAALYFNGANGFTGGGVRDLSLMLNSGLGDTTAYGILMQGDASYQPDEMIFENVWVTSSDPLAFWYTGFQAYGNARNHDPQGVRMCKLDNISLYQNRNAGLYLSAVCGWDLWGVRTYTGKGGGNDMYITGGPAGSHTNSWQVYGEAIQCSGTMHVDPASVMVRINGVTLAP